jgi:2-polyprenyl-6-methoxyphenol hydroxylase-like FAD-dependent oxidoreductase
MYDVIVEGARCAGASTAMLLARRGHKVLLVDRDEFPSDMTPSTHMVWHVGVARLKAWGLIDKLAATGCPPMRTFNLDVGAFVLRGEAPPAGDVSECYAPRRHVIDGLLVEAAVEAGVDLRRGSIASPIGDEGRVDGVRYTDPAGRGREERARIVVGAGGSNSVIAKTVDAPMYNQQPQLTGIVYGYFRDLPIDGMEFYSRPGRMIFAWSTHDGLTLAGMCLPYADYPRLAADPDRGIEEEWRTLVPEFHARVREARLVGGWRKGATRNFYRKSRGPGWALVGDSGLTMDPITAAGISNAFSEAERLAGAIDDGLRGVCSLDDALARYEAERDAATLPLYGFTCEMAKLEPPPQQILDLMMALSGDASAKREYFGLFAQTVRVEDFFAPDNIARIIGAQNSG